MHLDLKPSRVVVEYTQQHHHVFSTCYSSGLHLFYALDIYIVTYTSLSWQTNPFPWWLLHRFSPQLSCALKKLSVLKLSFHASHWFPTCRSFLTLCSQAKPTADLSSQTGCTFLITLLHLNIFWGETIRSSISPEKNKTEEVIFYLADVPFLSFYQNINHLTALQIYPLTPWGRHVGLVFCPLIVSERCCFSFEVVRCFYYFCSSVSVNGLDRILESYFKNKCTTTT